MKKLFLIIACVLLSTVAFAQKDKRPDSYNYNRAVEAIQNRNTEEALDYLGKEISDNPNNGYAYSWLAYVREAQEEYGLALTAADKAVKYLPGKDKEYVVFALSTRARIYYALEETDKALADYAKAIKVDPDNDDIYKDRAQIYYELEQYDLADKDYQKMTEIDPGNVVGYVGLGRNANAREQYQEAIDHYNYVIKLSSTYSSGYSFRAESYIGLKKYNEAIDDVIKALEIDGDNKAYRLLQDLADSASVQLIAKLKIQEASNPNNNRWPFYLGVAYDIKSNYKQATKCFQKSFEKEPLALTASCIASCYDELGDYESALSYIDTAIEMDSVNTRYLFNKSQYLDHMGRSNEAIAIMDEYINRDPRNFYGYYHRGWIKDHTKDYDGALEDYTISITLEPDYAYNYMIRGRLYSLRNEKDLARTDFEEAVKKDTIDGGGTAAMYANVYLGKHDEAIKILNRLLEEGENGNNYEAACVYSLIGDKTKSLDYLRKALEGGYYKFAHIRRDKDLDNIHDMPEFENLLKEYEEKVNKEFGNEDGKKEIFEEKVSEVPFTKEGGVYKVKCEINKLPLHFIFDTGASDVSISNVEANFMLKNNYLSPSDIIGKQNYLNANGDITEGTVINLKSVEFAGLTLSNIKASVVKNQAAPLLLGQSVLGKLGKIEIDNEKRILKVTMKQKK